MWTKPSVNDDISAFSALSSRNRESFNYIQLEYGQYAEDFETSDSYRVNPDTKKLEFSYSP